MKRSGLNIPMQAGPCVGLPAFFESMALYAQFLERRAQSPVRVQLSTDKPVILSPENPGQLAAHARFYLTRALAHPDSDHAERWAWLANQYHLHAAGKATPHRLSLQVKRADLRAGDVLSAGFFLSERHEEQEIVEIDSAGHAALRNVATGQMTTKHLRADSGSWGYSVVMGPKVEAIARKLPGVRFSKNPTYDDVYRWLSPSTTPQPSFHKEILITDWHVSPGDVIRRRGTQSRPMLIESINWPRACIRYQDGQKEQAIERIESTNARYVLLGGPKVEAARRDLSLIQFNPGPNNWLWVGKAKMLAGD